MGAGEIIGGIVQGMMAPAASIIGSFVNYKAQQETNQSNRDINQSNLDYNAAMTQQQWERDDTAHQREVADLEKAGLSPLASMNGTPTTSALGAPNPIAMQAPRFDVNNLVQSLLQNKALDETKRHNMAEEDYKSSSLDLQSKELKEKARQIDIQNKEVEADIKYQTRLLEIQSSNVDEIIRAHKKDEELRADENQRKMLEYQSQKYYKEVSQQAGNRPYKEFNDLNEYVEAYKDYLAAYDAFVDSLQETSKGSSKGKNFGGEVSAGASVVGTGGNGSIGGNYGSSESNQENISQKQSAMYDKFFYEHPVPVFIAKD